MDVEQSKWKVIGRHVDFKIKKKEDDQPYWSRLTKENEKFSWISIDWNRYIDEDEEGEEAKDKFDMEDYC